MCDFGKGFYMVDIPEQRGFCNMSGKLFVPANRKGYDSECFIETLMNSEVGEHLYHSPYTDMWIGETYIMAVLEDEAAIKAGECLSRLRRLF